MTTSPMTTKRREAIHRYVELVLLEQLASIRNAVAFALKGERMPTDVLYAKLARYGYIWRSRGERWVLKK